MKGNKGKVTNSPYPSYYAPYPFLPYGGVHNHAPLPPARPTPKAVGVAAAPLPLPPPSVVGAGSSVAPAPSPQLGQSRISVKKTSRVISRNTVRKRDGIVSVTRTPQAPKKKHKIEESHVFPNASRIGVGSSSLSNLANEAISEVGRFKSMMRANAATLGSDRVNSVHAADEIVHQQHNSHDVIGGKTSGLNDESTYGEKVVAAPAARFHHDSRFNNEQSANNFMALKNGTLENAYPENFDQDDPNNVVEYFDYSQITEDQIPDNPSFLPDHPCFPMKLHEVLSKDEYNYAVSWLPHGRAWRVVDWDALERDVIPQFFGHDVDGRSGFLWKVKHWCFIKIRGGADDGAYYHEQFLRGLPHLYQLMESSIKRKSNGCGSNNLTSSAFQKFPDLHEVSRICPLPANNSSSATVEQPSDVSDLTDRDFYHGSDRTPRSLQKPPVGGFVNDRVPRGDPGQQPPPIGPRQQPPSVVPVAPMPQSPNVDGIRPHLKVPTSFSILKKGFAFPSGSVNNTGTYAEQESLGSSAAFLRPRVAADASHGADTTYASVPGHAPIASVTATVPASSAPAPAPVAAASAVGHVTALPAPAPGGMAVAPQVMAPMPSLQPSAQPYAVPVHMPTANPGMPVLMMNPQTGQMFYQMAPTMAYPYQPMYTPMMYPQMVPANPQPVQMVPVPVPVPAPYYPQGMVYQAPN